MPIEFSTSLASQKLSACSNDRAQLAMVPRPSHVSTRLSNDLAMHSIVRIGNRSNCLGHGISEWLLQPPYVSKARPRLSPPGSISGEKRKRGLILGSTPA